MQQPNRSTCDARLLSFIWEAFNKWCQQQFDEKLGVRVLGLGEFALRKDGALAPRPTGCAPGAHRASTVAVIGDMEFVNPMFVIAESFARKYRARVANAEAII